MATLAERIKAYEKTFSFSTVNRMPIMVRVDGRAFHTFTRGMDKPFDDKLIKAMVASAIDTAKEMQGFKAGYIQSDEATFCLTDYDDINTQGWFGYDLSKMVSISAALMSVAFNSHFPTKKRPIFDSRAFTIPKEDVSNAFLWRAKDWSRNSLQMYCRSFFSSKELHKKKRTDMHEMLFGIGKNWTTDLSEQERNGTFILWSENGIISRTDILPTYEHINSVVGVLFEKAA